MKLSVSGLQKKPGHTENFAYVLENIDEDSELILAGPVKIEGSLTNTGSFLELTAHVDASVLSSCCKCLAEVTVPLELDFCEQYIPEGQREQFEKEGSNELVFLDYSEDLIDLKQAIRDNILLSLPMRILCTPECPGLCPGCGRSLKEGPCHCRPREGDPRLSVLAQLKNNS